METQLVAQFYGVRFFCSPFPLISWELKIRLGCGSSRSKWIGKKRKIDHECEIVSLRNFLSLFMKFM